MKKIISTILAALASVNLAWAGEITVQWQMPETTAHIDGFKIYQSDDQGQTWHEVKDVNATVRQYTLTDLPDDHLILWRVSAYNSAQESVRTNVGAWYNGLWTIPPKPKGAGGEAHD